ncbi:hypothetical protein B0I35DRAFT_232221 [Stachybotrys elegans]|uniref:Uncharacterized protein n=1 Tax=Stachybotrys elegans TaxID=80388 RepID=A0A8K0SP62_9HYPO|nr:hypothetical protein B0I35DRAFT_232221 [Stachybotrys elegans]
MSTILGGVVAFEGHQETISTQLRLLPTSSQILILPNIQSYLPPDCLERDLDPHTLIRRVQDAVDTRLHSARQFLQGSTPAAKRLVFLNGGTSSAQTLCIREIMRKETDGDAVKAEAIYYDLIQDGVAGLESRGREFKRRRLLGFQHGSDHEGSQDPISMAMRAADALDRLTANLQPSNELDLTSKPALPRRNSLPLYGYSDSFCDAAPFFLYGTHSHSKSAASLIPTFDITHYDHHADTPSCISLTPSNQPSPSLFHSPSPSPSCTGDDPSSPFLTPEDLDLNTPVSEPASPIGSVHVVFGQAEILDVRAASRKGHVPKVRSLDRVYPSSPKPRDSALFLGQCGTEPSSPTKGTVKSLPLSSVDHFEVAQKAVVGSQRPTVTITPVPEARKKRPSRPAYVDRGTDTQEVDDDPFRPVLPVTENLVIYFKDQVPDIILDSTIMTMRSGETRPVAAALKMRRRYRHSPDSPLSETLSMATTIPSYCPSTYGPHCVGRDSFACGHALSPWMPPQKQQDMPSLATARLPTPETTPRASLSGDSDKVHVFNVAPSQTAVAVQNSLRSVLNTHYSPETEGYHQFQFSDLPELEGLWKPIFRDGDFDCPYGGSKKMDQILAIGSQRGVSKEFSASVTAELEVLGIESTGISRTGRLDFRYLLANAMQVFTAQPLANQTWDNPFANPYLLATLIVPRLETYLALHSGIRYLILDYPPEHLPTVLALQKLVGVDLMKVAQIVDSNNKDALPFTHIRGTSTSTPPTRQPSPVPSYSSDVNASRANFLLASTASESEVETLVSTVRNILISISPFYRKEEMPMVNSPRLDKPLPRRPKSPVLEPHFSPWSKATNGRQSPSSPPSATFPPESLSSVSETVQTPRSSRSRSGSRWRNVDEQSLYTFDPAEEPEFDLEERRLMPMFMQKPPKGNSRKALKFLGLA